MPEQNSKYLNNYLNGVTYENAFWKIQYNELWNRFLYLQNENNRLYSLLNECYSNNPSDCSINNNITENVENVENTTENRENIKILSHLQNKNIQLINTVMDKSKEIFMLQGELEKHRQLKN